MLTGLNSKQLGSVCFPNNEKLRTVTQDKSVFFYL